MKLDFISMAEIANLSGQSRSTVGNWKTRYSDFPKECGSNSRGPLYDRLEILEWLDKTGRSGEQRDTSKLVLLLMDTLRESLKIEDSLYLLWAILGIKVTSERCNLNAWKDLLEAQSDLVVLFRRSCHELLPFLTDIFEFQVEDTVLHRVITLLDSSEISTIASPTFLDELTETVLRKSRYEISESTSPRSLRRLITTLAVPTGKVFDPAAGFGQLLVDAAQSSDGNIQLFAQEINNRSWEMGMLNLVVRGIESNSRIGNAITNDAFPQLLADLVLAIPPFNLHVPELTKMKDDPRWVFGEPSPRDGNSAWIQHCLHHLAMNGRAFIVLPPNVLFEAGGSGLIRQRIIKADLLDAVISLPPGLFSNTSIPTALLVFERGRKNKGNLSTPGPTFMFDASRLSEKSGRLATSISEKVIARISDGYHAWRAGNPIPSDPNSAIVDFDSISKNRFVIDPRRHVSGISLTIDRAHLSSRKARLQKSLIQAITDCNAADSMLFELLEKK